MVGKTSVLHRYINRKFIKIDVKNRTINTNYIKKKIQLNDKSFLLNIWDTAGEEKYHAIAPIFYRGADGAVIIFDVTRKETFGKAEKWFKELNQFCENNPNIILVGNKIDLPERQITNEESIELASKYKSPFLEVSALNGDNVDSIFNILTDNIYNKKQKEIEENNRKNIRNIPYKNKLRNITVSEKDYIKKKKNNCC